MSTGTKRFNGPSSIQIPRLTADPSGTAVNGEIYYNTTSNKFKQYVNGAWQSVVDENSVSGFAVNTALSNLTNPTALNQDLLGSADNVRSVGASANRMANVFSAIATINSMRVKDSGTAFYSAFVAPTMAANVTYTLPATDGTSGQQLTTNGSGVLSWSAASSGANTALSNLASVAINTALLSAADNTLALGAGANRWSNVFSAVATPNELRVKDSGSAFYNSFVSPSMGANVSYTLPATDGTSGFQLTTNGAGVLSWSASGSGANTSLSNLTTTSLNQDLIGSADNVRSLGAGATRFANVFSAIATPNALRIKDSGSAFYNSFVSPSMAANVSYTLPATDGTANQVLKTNGSGVLSWTSAGGSGANQTLSNLTNPTAINQDLIFDKALPVLQSKSVTAAATNSENLLIKSGNADDGSTGELRLGSGEVTANTGNSGEVYLESGLNSGTGSTGNMFIRSNAPTSGGGASGQVSVFTGNIPTGNSNSSGGLYFNTGTTDTGPTGGVNIYSGDAAAAGTGNVYIYSGTSASSNNNSGGMTIYTGAINGVGQSGNVTLYSGISNVSSGNSGGVDLYSGDVFNGASGYVGLHSGGATDTTGTSGGANLYTGATVDGASGAVQVFSGGASGSGATGAITINTGNSAGVGNSGALNIFTGGSTSGAQGDINISGKLVNNLNLGASDGRIFLGGAIGFSNGQNLLFQTRMVEKTLAASTASPTIVPDYLFTDNLYASVKLQYQMTEVSTGKVRRGTFYLVQDYNTPADVVYNDVVEVENASFPSVVLSAVSTGGNVEIRYTNPSANNIYFASLTQLEPIALGTV